MKKLVLFLMVVLVLAALGVVIYRGMSEGVVVYISEEQIQSQLDQRFPVEKGLLVLKTTLSEPRVDLHEGSDRVHFSVKVAASVPTQKPVSGSAEISGEVKYMPETGEFYLQEAKVEELEAAGLPERYADEVREVVSQVAEQVLNRFAVYKLDETDRRQSLAKLFLKSVSVSGGKLRIVMGVSDD